MKSMTIPGARGAMVLFLAATPLLAAEPYAASSGPLSRSLTAVTKHLPTSFLPGRRKVDGVGIDTATAQNVKWAARLGTQTYTHPAVANGRVFIGTNDQSLDDPRYPRTGGGLLLCLDEASGKLLWQLPVRRLERIDRSYFPKYAGSIHDLGICSSPTVDGDRVYVVTNRGEVLCLDIHGMADANDGPYRDEARYVLEPDQPPVPLQPTDADILWRFDMLSQLEIFPHDANSSAPLICGDVVYVGTANGVASDGTPCPLAPSLIALDKRTGRQVGYDDEKIGTRVFHGQWSSPSASRVGGRTLIFFGGGDGICYAFEALTEVYAKPVPLKCVWSCDCNPPEYRFRDGKPIDYWLGDVTKGELNRNDGQYVGPSEIIATPVCYQQRVYVAIGQDPEHGRARGCFVCLDATRTGDLTKSGKLWTYQGIQRSICTSVIADGLVYLADLAGTLHCLDAENGTCYWTYPTKQETWNSLLVADGKIYLGGRRGYWIFAAGKEPSLIKEIHLSSPVWCPSVVADGVLYVPSQRYLFAVQETGATPLAAAKPTLPAGR
jgi:outer membrane protein assembly factor BamB